MFWNSNSYKHTHNKKQKQRTKHAYNCQVLQQNKQTNSLNKRKFSWQLLTTSNSFYFSPSPINSKIFTPIHKIALKAVTKMKHGKNVGKNIIISNNTRRNVYVTNNVYKFQWQTDKICTMKMAMMKELFYFILYTISSRINPSLSIHFIRFGVRDKIPWRSNKIVSDFSQLNQFRPIHDLPKELYIYFLRLIRFIFGLQKVLLRVYAA